MKKIVSALLIAVWLPASVLAYTSPGAPTGHINDFAGVLSAGAKSEIASTLSAYERESSNQIAVVTIPELKDETIETYAVRLFQEWGIGQRDKDNGALFLISVNDRKMRIEVGYGLEGDLTDIEAKNIIDNIVAPQFRNNDFDAGVREGVSAIIQTISGNPPAAVSQSASREAGFDWGFIFWAGIFVFIWLGSVFARSRSWWAGGVVGAVAGGIVWIVSSAWFWLPILIVVGLLFDYLVSRKYQQIFINKKHQHNSILPWLFLIGGSRHRWDRDDDSFGGGFGGFGGGSSGGGGASGGW